MHSQTKTLKGKVIANDDVEGIHVLNKTSVKYTITDEKGGFEILAKLSDTLTISGLKYETKQVIVTQAMMLSESLEVSLKEKVNELDEVVVGKILTGSLESDIGNSDAERDIDFYDLGIPGYLGKPLTQSERRLKDADEGSTVGLKGGTYGAGAGVNLHKLLNQISGRTKKLKNRVKLEYNQKCLERNVREYAVSLFEKNPLADSLQVEYFFFCSEDPKFNTLCKEGDPIKSYEFMEMKLKKYKSNLKVREED